MPLLNLEGIDGPSQQPEDEELDPGYGTLEQNQILRLCDDFSNAPKPPYASEEIQIDHIQQRWSWTALDDLEISGLGPQLQGDIDISDFNLRH